MGGGGTVVPERKARFVQPEQLGVLVETSHEDRVVRVVRDRAGDRSDSEQ